MKEDKPYWLGEDGRPIPFKDMLAWGSQSKIWRKIDS